MLPNHIQTCLSLLVKSWRVAVPAGKTSRQGHTLPASSQEYTFHLREEVVLERKFWTNQHVVRQQPSVNSTDEKGQSQWQHLYPHGVYFGQKNAC